MEITEEMLCVGDNFVEDNVTRVITEIGDGWLSQDTFNNGFRVGNYKLTIRDFLFQRNRKNTWRKEF